MIDWRQHAEALQRELLTRDANAISLARAQLELKGRDELIERLVRDERVQRERAIGLEAELTRLQAQVQEYEDERRDARRVEEDDDDEEGGCPRCQARRKSEEKAVIRRQTLRAAVKRLEYCGCAALPANATEQERSMLVALLDALAPCGKVGLQWPRFCTGR